MTTPTARLTRALAGRYVIEDEVGVGGLATVYRARDLKHERAAQITAMASRAPRTLQQSS